MVQPWPPYGANNLTLKQNILLSLENHLVKFDVCLPGRNKNIMELVKNGPHIAQYG